MGLAERRAAKEFETSVFPQLKKEVDTAAGFDVPIEVNWDSLAIEGASHLYADCWPKVYFKPLVYALRNITVDNIGKEALKAGLKKISILNQSGTSNADKVATFDKGELKLDHKPTTNVDDISQRAKAIQNLLESKL